MTDTAAGAPTPAVAGSGVVAPPGRWQRRLMWGLAAIVVVHSALVALWLAPPGPVRDAVGSTRLAAYVDPYFVQSGTTMDPGRQVVDEALLVRARVDGEVTEWLDLTEIDRADLANDVAPARVRLASRRLATGLNAAYFKLSPQVRPVAEEDRTEAGGLSLSAALRQAGASSRATRAMVAQDTMATRYASLVALAYWGEADQVQVRIGRREVPDGPRTAGAIDDVPFTWVDLGWRRLAPASGSARSAFDDYAGVP